MELGRIPRVLHQIAPDEQVPEHLQAFRSSWRYWNPDLEVILWTDRSLRGFILQSAPAFLPFFDGYGHGVCKADLGRYLLLQHFGGIYADLDCQCLRPLAPLLEGRELVVAPEPEVHHQQTFVLARGLDPILSPSFMASVPAHPFWEEVLTALSKILPGEVVTMDDVLDATGPFLLSRVFAANPLCERSLVAAELINPFSKADCWQGKIFDPIFWSERSSGAFVAHYWDGSWFRRSLGWRAGVPPQAPVQVQVPSRPVVRPGVVARNTGSAQRLPLISCLMVASGDGDQAELAIDAFLAQTYGRRELIVVDNHPGSGIAVRMAGKQSTMLRHVQIDEAGQALTSLFNIALENALGDYVCCWHDCELHDPVRLEVQFQAMRACDAQASVLARSLHWWPRQQQFALSPYHDWQGSLLCERSLMPRYPPGVQQDDSGLLDRLKAAIRVARIDLPRLCLRIRNCAPAEDQADQCWQEAETHWQQAEGERLEQELNRRLPMASYRRRLGSRSLPLQPASASARQGDPAVLILTPVRNAVPYLERYSALLERLDYDPYLLSVAWLEGDSTDQTYAELQRLRSRLSERFSRVCLHRHHLYPPQTRGERWQTSLQRDRRERLAQIRNRLLMVALRQEQWVLWLDVDVCDYPPDLLHQLLAAGREIVTANCLGPTGDPFDLNSYRLASIPDLQPQAGRASPPWHGLASDDADVDGLLQPPVGVGRHYVNEYKTQSLVELDAVGGTVLLIRADLHRHGLAFPPYPIGGLIETEALSLVAREQGVRSWALPQLIVRHA